MQARTCVCLSFSHVRVFEFAKWRASCDSVRGGELTRAVSEVFLTSVRFGTTGFST